MDKHFYIEFKDEKMQKSVRRILFFIAPLILLLSLEVMHIAHLETLMRFFATGYFVQKLILSYVSPLPEAACGTRPPFSFAIKRRTQPPGAAGRG